jgi:6-phosphogluconolactonase
LPFPFQHQQKLRAREKQTHTTTRLAIKRIRIEMCGQGAFDVRMKTGLAFLVSSIALFALSFGAMTLRAATPGQETEPVGELMVFFGTYTGAKSKGIYVSRLNLGTGILSEPKLAAEIVSPSFLALSPDHSFLYAVNEVGSFAGKKSGAVSAFAIDQRTGALKLLNQQPSGGGGPCHLIVDRSGKNVLVANYGGGSVSVFPLAANGSLGEATAFVQHQGSSVNQQRQRAPHAHGIYVDAGNRFAFVPDLGTDRIFVYKFDAAKGTLAPGDPPFATLSPGSGPRHFAFHPNSRNAYVINELLCTITAFNYDPDRGRLEEIQTISTLPEGQAVSPSISTAEIEVHPSGNFLYGSNRGHDTIALFAIDQERGTLRLVQHEPTRGKTPRNFAIDPTGLYLLAANQNSDSVVVFRIDIATGRLAATGHSIEVGAPVCVQFMPPQPR